ncbi:MAG: LysM peptidoglycan-binding domain-containing protein [Candidatus Sericytochromatia bacterium]|nr:LysM peptidoglycan-binding domain-containing protein [Candidatus Tanganyikabacteria bacterium]
MPKVGGNERVRVQRGQTLEQIAKKYGVKPEDITRADGTPAAGGVMPGETVIIHHKAEPNRAQAIIALLAEATAAREAAEDAQRRADLAQARDEAFAASAKDFNGTVKKLRVLLTHGEGNETTLADREKGVKELKDLVAAAEAGLEKLDPGAQEPARDVVESLKARVAKVESRAQAERAKLTELDAALDAEYKAFTDMANGDKKQRAKKFPKLARELFAKYQDPAKISDGLPPDAKKALGDKMATFNKDLHRTIVRFSDESWFNERDNGYLFGRPGPKMQKHLKQVEEWLNSAPGPVDAKKRTELLEHLSEMDEAVRDFDDPVTKAAAKSVYDDVAARAFARLSGK